MTNVGLNILVLSFAFLASAQVPNDCSAPPKYAHARLEDRYANKQKFSSGEKVRYKCEEDFESTRGSRAVECVDGVWGKLTLKCEKKTCGNAGELPNGEFVYEGNTFIGDKVYAVCKDGFTLKGLNYMICKKSGWSGDIPSCEVSTGEEATCLAPAVPDSVSSGGDAAVFRVGDILTFNCNHGFQLDGDRLITCGPDGQWQTRPPRCLPVTSPSPDKPQQSTKPQLPTEPQLPTKAQLPNKQTGRCGLPETFGAPNVHLADKYISKTSFTSGERVYYVCDVGYVHAGGSRYRKCGDGEWTRLLMKCERRTCGSAGEITNGQFEYSGVEFGDTATAVCDEGYQLVGRATRNCLDKGWDGRVPACEAVYCGEPPASNAVMKDQMEQSYTYRSVVQYKCPVGTLQGPQEIWCTSDGTWSSPPPTCGEITCPSPRVSAGFWAGSPKRLYQYRDTITIECHRGYMRMGPSIITCGRDGRWFPGLPRCTRPQHRRNWRH